MGEKTKTQKKGAAKVRHLGRRKAQIARYYAVTYRPRKLRRVFKNNGANAARAYADKHGLIGLFNKLSQG